MAGLLIRLGLVTGLIVAFLAVVIWRTASSSLSPDVEAQAPRRPLVSQPVVLSDPVVAVPDETPEIVTLSAPATPAEAPAAAQPTEAPPVEATARGIGEAAPAVAPPSSGADASNATVITDGPLETMTVPLPQPDPRRLQAAADNGTAQP